MPTTPVIIDLIVAAVLVAFTLYGAHRGLFRAMAGLVAIVVALVGAGLIASACAGPAARWVTPFLAERIEEQVTDAVAVQSTAVMPEADLPAGDSLDLSDLNVEDLLRLMGLDSDVRGSMVQEVEEKVRDTGVSIIMAIVESVAQSIIYAVLYIVSFVVLTLLLRLVIRAVDAVLRLPGLHMLNSLGGGAVGVLEGCLLLFLAIWLLRRLGVSFETPEVAATTLLRFFATNTPLSALSFLQ